MSRARGGMPSALKLHGPQVEYVGKLFKQAKRRVLWKFVRKAPPLVAPERLGPSPHPPTRLRRNPCTLHLAAHARPLRATATTTA